jgi:hypothetical protein
VTSGGLPGPDLHKWKLKEHQAGLDEMTAAYLDRQGSGLHYWPDSEISANYNKLQFSKDRPKYTFPYHYELSNPGPDASTESRD